MIIKKFLFVSLFVFQAILLSPVEAQEKTPEETKEVYSEITIKSDLPEGYRLSLTPKQGGGYDAQFFIYEGADEPFLVTLSKQIFDDKSGEVKFSGKMSNGTHHCPKHNGVAAEEEVTFTGKWHWAIISGQLTRTSLLHPETTSSKQISLGKE